jgi:hypothetical protein
LEFVLAGLLAALFGNLELRSRLKSRQTRKAKAHWWWLGLLAVEALAGVGAAAAISEAATPTGLVSSGAAGLVGGMAGSAAVRLRVVTIGKGDEQQPIGPATLYEPLRDFFEGRINDCYAAYQSDWINSTVRPTFRKAGVTPQEIVDRVSDYVTHSVNKTPAECEEEARFLQEIADDAIEEDKKIRTLILRACALEAYRVIDDMLTEAEKRLADASNQPPEPEKNPAEGRSARTKRF